MKEIRPFKSGFCYGYIGGVKLKSGQGKHRLVKPIIDSTDVERLNKWLNKAISRAPEQKEELQSIKRMCRKANLLEVNENIRQALKSHKSVEYNLVWWQQIFFYLDDLNDGVCRQPHGYTHEERMPNEFLPDFSPEIAKLYNTMDQESQLGTLAAIMEPHVQFENFVLVKDIDVVFQNINDAFVKCLISSADQWKQAIAGLSDEVALFRILIWLHREVIVALWFSWYFHEVCLFVSTKQADKTVPAALPTPPAPLRDQIKDLQEPYYNKTLIQQGYNKIVGTRPAHHIIGTLQREGDNFWTNVQEWFESRVERII